MLRTEHIVLKFSVITLITVNVNAEILPENPLVFLNNILGQRFKNPLIVVLNRGSNFNTLLRTSNDQSQGAAASKTAKSVDKPVDGKSALRYVNEIIQSTGDESDPSVKKTVEKYKSALRARCEKYIECEVTCKKKKDPCADSCEDVYDALMVCKPIKDEWLSKTNKGVYQHLKRNPPQYRHTSKRDMCSTKGPEWSDSDEC